MKIEWVYESFESGLKTWETEFRGMFVEIRQEGEDCAFKVSIRSSREGTSLWAKHEDSIDSAMINALKWVNGYWDALEDGADVVYEVTDVSEMDDTLPAEEETA